MKIPGYELVALRRVAGAADELVDAIRACDETRISGCNFEIQFSELQAALNALPRYYERGRYIWKEIEEDYQHDAPGG
jgi:hypothetical protein